MPEHLIPSADARLAIVIPAYKAMYLRECLQAISAQTDRRFYVYVGDDCSPEPLGEIVREFSAQLPITYHRFESNVGGKSLVQQWERCVRLTHEPWIWLFSDDDFMDPGCVAAFYEELKNTRESHDLYRFNTIWVNSAKGTRAVSPPHPTEESGAEFLKARLRSSRNSTLQELIFSRQAWTETGIPEFSLAWCSDDAFIALLGRRRAIRTIAGPLVYWRLSGVNITNDHTSASTRIKLKASMSFLRWTVDYFKIHRPAELCEARPLAERRLVDLLANCWIYLDRPLCREIEAWGAEVLGRRAGWGWRMALRLNARLTVKKILARLKLIR